MRKFWRGLRYAAQGILILLLASLLAYNLYTSAARASGQALPKLFGFSGAVIISGSMSGVIEIDDVVIAREQPVYAPGDVILFQDPGGSVVCHRIVRETEAGFITKGTANNVEDRHPTPPQRVFGKVIWVLPRAGLAQRYVRSPLGRIAVILAAAAMVMLSFVGRNKRTRGDEDVSPPL